MHPLSSFMVLKSVHARHTDAWLANDMHRTLGKADNTRSSGAEEIVAKSGTVRRHHDTVRTVLVCEIDDGPARVSGNELDLRIWKGFAQAAHRLSNAFANLSQHFSRDFR